MTEAEPRSISVWLKPLQALRVSYIAKKLRFHSLAGLENWYILLAVPVATVILFAVFARFEFAMLRGQVVGPG